MRAVLISVDYADYLSITLPYNRHHFSDVLVITTPQDDATQQVAKREGCEIYCTDTFYARGASFNKWAALEEGLDYFLPGRRGTPRERGDEGWICLMDADVLWPKEVRVSYPLRKHNHHLDIEYQRTILTLYSGQLCTPLRRLYPNTANLLIEGLPPEKTWNKYPVHQNIREWAGYSQIFHCGDPYLGEAPWHQIDWRHAGGADSFFQQKWPPQQKVRPPFECLHLGLSGVNWAGRATQYLDGSIPLEAEVRAARMKKLWTDRRGKRGDDRFRNERLR